MGGSHMTKSTASGWDKVPRWLSCKMGLLGLHQTKKFFAVHLKYCFWHSANVKPMSDHGQLVIKSLVLRPDDLVHALHYHCMFSPCVCIDKSWQIACCLWCVSGKPYWRGRLSTVDLQIKVACFVIEVNNVFNIKISWSKLFSTRRSTVLRLPPLVRALCMDTLWPILLHLIFYKQSCQNCKYDNKKNKQRKIFKDFIMGPSSLTASM